MKNEDKKTTDTIPYHTIPYHTPLSTSISSTMATMDQCVCRLAAMTSPIRWSPKYATLAISPATTSGPSSPLCMYVCMYVLNRSAKACLLIASTLTILIASHSNMLSGSHSLTSYETYLALLGARRIMEVDQLRAVAMQ